MMLFMLPDRDHWVSYFRDHLPEMLEDLERLVECESPSHDHDALRRSADLVARIGTRLLDSEPEWITHDDCPHLRWRLPPTGDKSAEAESEPASSVLLLGHHDTVWPIGSLVQHPYVVEETARGRVARGSGCFDMLSGVVQLFHAVAALQDHPARQRGGVTILITGDEEIGSPSSQQMIEDEARLASACFVLEASGNGGALKTRRKGVSRYRLEVTGRAAHAGLEPELGINAGVELATQLVRLVELGDVERGTSVTPTTLAAGTTSNTVPAEGWLEVDCRAWTVEEQQRVDGAIRGLRPVLPGSAVAVVGGINRPPMEETFTTQLYAWAVEEAGSLGLVAPEAASVGGGSDGNFSAGVGTPTLDGLGAVGGGAHGADEHVQVEEIPGRTALLATLIVRVLTESSRP